MAEWTLDRSYAFRGQSVRYRVLGEGPPIVLVHGTPFSSYVWHRIAPYLAEHRQVFFFALSPELHEAILTTYVRGAIERQIPVDELRPYLRPWLGEQGQAAFYRQIGQFDQRFTDEIEQRYQLVRSPTLILWGEQDQWL